jgi:Thioredoxin
MKAALSAEQYRAYFYKGISFSQYVAEMQEASLHPESFEKAKYIPLNYQRVTRLIKTIQLQAGLQLVINALSEKRYWLVLTEHWCGDASQLVSLMNAVSLASNNCIELRFIYRDQHPDLMKQHLTNGTHSIPIIIQLNSKFELINTWGPRPVAAIELLKKLMADPITAATHKEALHLWYARDKTIATQLEMIAFIKTA